MSSNACFVRDIEIPPRKRFTAADATSDDSETEQEDPYSSDQFRMYEFKVRRCTRSRSHDWTDCPFAHPGEKARRRDPRRHQYSAAVCPEFRRGGCSRGDSCSLAHGVFECWLHPARYRTEACKDGRHCNRKVCFFAHSPRQLRLLPPTSPDSDLRILNNKKKKGSAMGHQQQHQCCCCGSSPTSTLLGFGGLSSPPASPLSELVSSLEALRVASPRTPFHHRLDDQYHLQFPLSPSPRRHPLAADSNSDDPDIGWVDDLLM